MWQARWQYYEKLFHPWQTFMTFLSFTISANNLQQFWERHFLFPQNGENPLELEEQLKCLPAGNSSSQTGFTLVDWSDLRQYSKQIVFQHKLNPITATMGIHNSLCLQNLSRLPSGIWMNPKLSLCFGFYLPGFTYVLHFFRIKFNP